MSKNKKSKLHETTLGFELFDEILQDWIDEKIDEIEKNKNLSQLDDMINQKGF